MVLYGQIVIGAPGAGKTTYCDGMQQYLNLLGRGCHVVNLDPANEIPPAGAGDGQDQDSRTAAEEVGDDGDGTAEDNTSGEDKGGRQGGEGESSNAQLPYDTILDVCQDVISLDSVMSELDLGPNGGLLYCMEYIEHHLEEILRLLKERLGISGAGSRHSSRAYLLFDLPGQIELTAHSNVVGRIAERLVHELDLRLVCVQLVDAAVCLTDVSKFIGAALICTASMMRLELPCVNVLSKMDLLMGTALGDTKEKNGSDSGDDYGYDDNYGTSALPFNLEFFTQCHELHRLVDYLDSNPVDVAADADLEYDQFEYREDPEYQEARSRTRRSNFHRKYRKLHNELCDVVEDFGLLSFLPLSIQDAESVGRVIARVDKCNGYVFLRRGSDAVGGGQSGDNADGGMQDLFSSAIVADGESAAGALSGEQEKYLGEVVFREDIAELRGGGGTVAERRRIEKERAEESIT